MSLAKQRHHNIFNRLTLADYNLFHVLDQRANKVLDIFHQVYSSV